MSDKENTPTCCLTLPLVLEKWQEDRLSKRLELARQIYNTLLRYELNKLNRLKQSPQYFEIQEEIRSVDQTNPENKVKLEKLYKQRMSILKDILRKSKFSKYGFKEDAKNYYKHFNDNIGSSVAVHGIATQVWTAFDKVLFGNGKKVHFKKIGEIDSVQGYSASQGKSGGIEIMFRGTYIEWKGLKLPLKLSPKNDYENEMLSHHVKYVRILRKPGRSKDRWYAQLVLEGRPAVKRIGVSNESKHHIGHGAVGLDIGPQTLAVCSNEKVELVELADKVQNIETEKRLLQRKMDRSRRATNPDNYKEDGTIKRGVKLTHNRSKRYLKLQKRLAYIQYQQAELRKRQHIDLANHLLSLGDIFYVEKMNWTSLSKKVKKTEISEKTGKFKRKKRFGKSIANKAPATLIMILKNKCTSRGICGVKEVPTKVKASQYNHQSKKYTKKSLSQRWNHMPDGNQIQRDLYSAFLLQHYDITTTNFDQESLERDYPRFVQLHDQTIRLISEMSKTPSSMGIKRSIS